MKSTFYSALLLAVTSGATALSHELLWTRRLVDLLGATGEATSRVFGCFFLGLAVGGLVAARILPRIQRPWLAVAASEFAIAVLAIPALGLPSWTDWIWPALGPDRLVSWQGTLIKTLLSAAVILPPAIPMGMTLPFFVAAALPRQEKSSRKGVWLYGMNTLGGVIGLLVTSTVLLELLGVAGCMATAIAVNFLIGLSALQLSRMKAEESEPTSARSGKKRRKVNRQQESPDLPGLALGSCVVLSFVSGLAMLALELMAIRMIGLVVPSSFQATAAVLASVILFLAIAALATPLLLRLLPSPRAWLLISLTGAMALASLAPQLLYLRTKQLVDVSHFAAMTGTHLATTAQFLMAVCGVAMVTVGPALLVGGLVFPMILASTDTRERGNAQGRRFGYLLAANGIGGIVGAELTDLAIL